MAPQRMVLLRSGTDAGILPALLAQLWGVYGQEKRRPLDEKSDWLRA
jgi:hypothetical protein